MKLECAFFGSAAKPIEVKTSKAGRPYGSLSVGVDCGEVRDDGSAALEWVRVTIFADAVEALAGKVEKGTRLYIEGTLRPERWRGSDGEQRFTLAVSASKAERVGQSAIGRNRERAPRGSMPERPKNISARQLAEAAFRPDSSYQRDKPKVMGRDDFDNGLNDAIPF